MRKFSLLVLASALGAALCAAPASAQDTPSLLRGGETSPNFFGTTGLLMTPSAQTVGDRGVAGHAYFTNQFQSYGVTVGPFDRLEVGGTLIDPDNASSRVIFNAKFALLKETWVLPGFSVGVTDAFEGMANDPSWYLVASKDLQKLLPLPGLNLRVNFGYGGGLYNDDIFAGVEMDLWSPLNILPVTTPRFTAMAEYAADNVNIGLRGRYRGFAATLALFDWDNFGGGFSYTTGLRLW